MLKLIFIAVLINLYSDKCLCEDVTTTEEPTTMVAAGVSGTTTPVIQLHQEVVEDPSKQQTTPEQSEKLPSNSFEGFRPFNFMLRGAYRGAQSVASFPLFASNIYRRFLYNPQS